MAKKKKRKEEPKKEFKYTAELIGVILMLSAILGIGKYGPVGEIISSFCIFLVGTYYGVLLVAFFVVGFYLLLKREWPNFFSTKLIGLYIFVIALLIWAHDSYISQHLDDISKIFQDTIQELTGAFQHVQTVNFELAGGGILGCAFGVLFTKLFDYQGMVIMRWALLIIGLTLFTGFSIVDLIKNTWSKSKELLPKHHEKKEKSKEDRKKVIISGVDLDDKEQKKEEEKEDKRIVISSLKDLEPHKEALVVREDVTPDEKEDKEEPLQIKQDNSNENHLIVREKNYILPPITLLAAPKKSAKNPNQVGIEHNIVVLEQVLSDFGVIGKVVEVHVGPTVTQYELELQSGTKVSRLLGIYREIALALAKKDVRIEAPIPGKKTVGIELANDYMTSVSFREVLEGVPKEKKDSKLLAPLGKDINGDVKWCEIDKTPHLLVAGTTGSGKSVCINGIICSILMRTKPDEVRLVLVDPKKVELSVYNGTPHLLCPVVTDPKKASVALAKIVSEMERRYDVFSDSKTKNIKGYNEYIEQRNQTLPDDEKLRKMPYIVVIVDELADLMLVASKEVEDSIMRITQMARAAGIHLIIATQRPSTDVITGLIKANIPSRISFAVSNSIDSRTILDMTGAEKLLGKGDMLFFPMGDTSPTRIQGAFISDDEIKKIIDYTVAQQIAQYDENMMNLAVADSSKSASQREDENQEEEYDDPLYNEIAEFVIQTGKASASLLQRRFRLGYNRAARVIDLLEERGIIGPANGSKPREVLVKLEEQDESSDE